jgi:hypothetical protein
MELPIFRPLFTPPPLTAHTLAARCVSTLHGSVHTHSFVKLRIPCSCIPNFIAVSLYSFLSSCTILHSHSPTSTPPLPFNINLSACLRLLVLFFIFPDNGSFFSSLLLTFIHFFPSFHLSYSIAIYFPVFFSHMFLTSLSVSRSFTIFP